MRFLFSTVLFISLSNSVYACLPADLCARVTGLQDVPLGTWGGSGDLTSNYTMCAYIQNDDESNYEVTGSGTGAGGLYALSNGTTDISVTIEYEEDSDPGWITLNENIATIFPNPNTVDETCAVGGDSGKIRVTVPESTMEFATSGSYSGTINILLSPD